jgi:hypothetical protein
MGKKQKKKRKSPPVNGWKALVLKLLKLILKVLA